MAEGKSLDLLSRVHANGAARHHIEAALIVGAVVLIAALLGVALRSAGLLAAASPANAILLGLLVRFPHPATPAGWTAAVAAYVLADILTGNTLVNTLLLTVASLTGVASGYFLLNRLSEHDRRLIGPMSVLRLAVVVLVASAMAALVGTLGNFAALANAPLTGFVYWLVGELVNYLAILPVILAMPDGLIRRYDVKSRPDFRQIDFLVFAPAGLLVVAGVAAPFVGGPGAFALPLVALVWCALSYSVFTTAVLTLAVGIWMLGGIALGLIAGWPELDEGNALISVRLAITLMGLAPLTIASAMAAHRTLRDRFELLASYDMLSGLLTRHAFIDSATQLLADAAEAETPVAVLMLDIDHFKKINHTHGHWAGDRAIETFAVVVRRTLGDSALVGRLGGEEFAALLAGSTPADASAAADRVRPAIAAAPIDLGNGRHVEATLSIGLGCAPVAPASIETLLQVADEALSLAKGGGRNRIVRRDLPAPRVASPMTGMAARSH
jgi:diguanylate cyclase (GGDEF)-like protein